MPYDPSTVEPRWQKHWDEHETFRTVEDPSRPKYYVLDMFPYPSGAGLHVGHPEGYTATDVIARYKRARGFNVLHPMGWDAFGLPAERAAMRDGIHPAVITKRNTDNFRRQIKSLGFSYDWSREVNTSAPDFYRWTQWIFLRLHERGLAYRAKVPVNWCPALGTVLANEEVGPDGTYKETGDLVERRDMTQWMLRITAYAERLLQDLDGLDWPEPVKKMQRDWIGRSEGAEIDFSIVDSAHRFTAYTTRPDTLHGATYCVLAPEHPLVAQIVREDCRVAVAAYVEAAGRRSEKDRRAEGKEKTGVDTGAKALNPATGEAVPIWIADYVLANYGTGAIMAVPGHDERDHAFATAFELPIKTVVAKKKGARAGDESPSEAFTETGFAVNSGSLDGLSTEQAKRAIVEELEAQGVARPKVQYALRDWLFSRQRYWGEPFPIVITEDDEAHPLPDDVLPIELPHVDAYRPTEDGRPPLARASDWLQTTEPKSGRPALRETNTMPQWAGSCWYWLRFMDPHNTELPFDPEKEKYWGPVDLYIGGTEHAVLHLLYARFWHKVLFDAGLVHTKEPFQKLFNQGMIRAWSYKDAERRYYSPSDVEQRGDQWFVKGTDTPVETQIEKMSKGKLNVVNPDDVVAEYGADSLRLYELFMGPLEMAKPWDPKGIEGVHRFLHRVWRLVLDAHEDTLHAALSDEPADEALLKARHATVAGVTEDLEHLRFNTAIAKLMELCNLLSKAERRPKAIVEDLIVLLAPFAPHLCEELWSHLGHSEDLSHAKWLSFDASALVEDTIEMPIAVNGKVRSRLVATKDADRAGLEKAAMADEKLLTFLDGKTPKKVIVIPGKMVNVVI